MSDKKSKKIKRHRDGFVRDAILVPNVEWLSGHSADEVERAREKFIESALRESLITAPSCGSGANSAANLQNLATEREILTAAFEACWAAIAAFVESRGRAALSAEAAREKLSPKKRPDSVIKLQVAAAQAFERLDPLQMHIWSDMVARGLSCSRPVPPGSQTGPGAVLAMARGYLDSRVYIEALGAYKKKTRKNKDGSPTQTPGPRKDFIKRQLCKTLSDVWVNIFGKELTTSTNRRSFRHFLNIILPLSNHQLKASLVAAEADISQLGGEPHIAILSQAVAAEGETAGEGTVARSTTTTIKFQEECERAAKKEKGDKDDHALVGSVMKWAKGSGLLARQVRPS